MELFAYLEVAQGYEQFDLDDWLEDWDDWDDWGEMFDFADRLSFKLDGRTGMGILLALMAVWSTVLAGAARAVEAFDPGFRAGAASTFVPVTPANGVQAIPVNVTGNVAGCANAICRAACGDNSSGGGNVTIVPPVQRPENVPDNTFVPIRPSPLPGVFMRRGDVGPEIVQLQNLLRNAGYFDAASTGFFASLTEAGVRAFQHDRGLPVDGIVGEQTFAALGGFRPVTPAPLPAPLPPSGVRQLQIGDRGAEVLQLQLVLQNLGFYQGPLDGIFAASTEQAVITFQQARGIPVSGIADATTLAQLGINPSQIAAR